MEGGLNFVCLCLLSLLSITGKFQILYVSFWWCGSNR